MNTNELKQAKRQAEKDIRAIIVKFSEDTGLKVIDARFDAIDTSTHSDQSFQYSDVEMEVRL